MSCVMCQKTFISNYFFGQNGGANRLRVYYQRGLPRLVLDVTTKHEGTIMVHKLGNILDILSKSDRIIYYYVYALDPQL